MESGRKTYWNNKKYYFADIPLVRRCPHLTKVNTLFADDPLEVGSSLCNGLAVTLHLFSGVHSDSFYAHLISFSAVLHSGAILSCSNWRVLYKSS